jgi:50S ribosomal subunit-associated GTPase HflX
VVKKDGQILRLKLKVAKVSDAPAPKRGPGTEELAAAKRKIAESQEKMKKLREEREKLAAERAAEKK